MALSLNGVRVRDKVRVRVMIRVRARAGASDGVSSYLRPMWP